MWAYDHVVDGFVLVLVADFFDFKGPLEISKHLFKAYNAAATPPEIDPFIVRVHSPDQVIFDEIKFGLGTKITKALPTGEPVLGEDGKPIFVVAAHIEGLTFRNEWVYKLDMARRRRSPANLMRQWAVFKNTVDRLAA